MGVILRVAFFMEKGGVFGVIVVNGEEKQGIDGKFLGEFLKEFGYEPTRIAVEYNGVILPKEKYAKTKLLSGDCLEIVQFVGGG